MHRTTAGLGKAFAPDDKYSAGSYQQSTTC
jgi:hypothetical protein